MVGMCGGLQFQLFGQWYIDFGIGCGDFVFVVYFGDGWVDLQVGIDLLWVVGVEFFVVLFGIGGEVDFIGLGVVECIGYFGIYVLQY